MKTRQWIGAAVAGLVLALVPVVPAEADGLAPASASAGAFSETQVYITNRYSHQIQVVAAFRDSACTGWLVRGWFVIDSGETKHVVNTDRDYFLYYAESTADDRKWSGSVIDVNVPSNKFGTCDTYMQEALSSTRPVGLRMRNFTPGLTKYTLSLTP